MNSDSLRLFIAVPVPEPVRDALSGLQGELRGSSGDVSRISWVRPENFHLTLRFLGAVAQERLPNVERAIRRAVWGHPAFELRLEGIGSFPQALWSDVRGPGTAWLRELALSVDVQLEEVGFEREMRPFVPHLTLARIRGQSRSGWPSLEWLAPWREWRGPVLPVSDVALYESLPRADGAGSQYSQYRMIQSFALGARRLLS